jgi:hypothetical protein
MGYDENAPTRAEAELDEAVWGWEENEDGEMVWTPRPRPFTPGPPPLVPWSVWRAGKRDPF